MIFTILIQLVTSKYTIKSRFFLGKLPKNDVRNQLTPLKGQSESNKRNKYYRLKNDKLTIRRCHVTFVPSSVDTFKLD